MRCTARFLLVLTAAAVAASPASAQAPQDAIAVVDAFHAAMAAGDSAAALATLHEDLVVFESGRVEHGRAEYRAHHFGADMAFSLETERALISRSSGGDADVAWVLSRTHTTGTFRDRDVDSEGDETMVLHRTAAGWRIVHIHWSQRRRS
jgi:ketosteroid isomerase-like protein